MKVFLNLMIVVILVGCSCSEDKSLLSRDEVLKMARKGDPDLIVVIPKDMSSSVVECNSYTPPCQNGYKVKIKGLEMIALYYLSYEEALNSAKANRAYYYKNWVFDDVKGEPILERFAKKYLHAIDAE